MGTPHQGPLACVCPSVFVCVIDIFVRKNQGIPADDLRKGKDQQWVGENTNWHHVLLPIFDYNDFFYYMLNQEKQDKLQTMQNRILRIVYRNKEMSTNDMYDRIGTGKLQDRKWLHLCGLMYKRSGIYS